MLHISRVTSSTEDDGDLGVGVDIVGSDQGTSGIVDQGGHLGSDVLRASKGNEERGIRQVLRRARFRSLMTDVFLQRLFKHGSDIVSLHIGSSESLGPPDEL